MATKAGKGCHRKYNIKKKSISQNGTAAAESVAGAGE